LKVRHKVNHGWVRPEAPMTAEYEAEVAAALRKAEKAWRKAQKALERAEKAAATRPDPTTRAALDEARWLVLARLDELRQIEALMQAAPAGRAPRFEGVLKARHVHGKGSKL
jgi:hypothetical protein